MEKLKDVLNNLDCLEVKNRISYNHYKKIGFSRGQFDLNVHIDQKVCSF
jgi:hypothetical protein